MNHQAKMQKKNISEMENLMIIIETMDGIRNRLS